MTERHEAIVSPDLNLYNNNTWLFLLTFSLVIVAETVSYNLLGVAFTAFQAFVVVFYLVRGRFVEALIFHSLFLLTSLEWPADLGCRPTIYTYRSLELFDVTISTIVLLALFLLNVAFTSPERVTWKRVNIFGALIFMTALATGIAGMLFGDYSTAYFISDLQGWFVFLMSFTLMQNVIFSYGKSFANVFERILIFVVTSRSIVAFFGSAFGFNKGSYGGIPIFSYDAIDLLIPVLVLSVTRLENKYLRIMILFSWFLGFAEALLYRVSGKEILLFAGVIFFLLYRSVSARISIVTKVAIIILLVVFALGIIFFIPKVLESSLLFSIKYNEAVSLISTKWIFNPYILPPSPRDRVLELYNTSAFYLEKPLFLLTGRGFGGYFEDRYFYNNTASGKAGYTAEEVKTRRFVNPHESFNEVFLKFGISGVILWLYYLVLLVRKTQIKASVFLRAVGLILVLLALGYSIKLVYIAAFCLAISMIEERRYEENSFC